MKNIVIIALVVFGVYSYYNNSFSTNRDVHYDELPVMPSVTGKRSEKFEIDDLFKTKTTPADLAQKGAYTIVEFYQETCSTCKLIESKFPSFLQERKDFVVKRVRLPHEGYMFYSEKMKGYIEDNMDELRDKGITRFIPEADEVAWKENEKAKRKFYRLVGTPHIEIYDEKGELIAKDEDRNKFGLKLLRRWLKT